MSDMFRGYSNRRPSRHLAASECCPLYALFEILPPQPALGEWEAGTTMCMVHFHCQMGKGEHHNRITTMGLHQTSSGLNVKIESVILKGQPETSNSPIITGRKYLLCLHSCFFLSYASNFPDFSGMFASIH